MLNKMGLKRNMYYEIKDKVLEERQDGVRAYKQKVRVKEFGIHSTAAIRKILIDILIDRVEHHKDKIISPIIYNELLGMEIKKGGKVEHSDNTHDDQIFSMLMALYVWYEGVNLAERYGIRKTTIKTDEDIDEELNIYDSNTVEIVEHFNVETPLNEEIQRDIDALMKAHGITLDEFLEKRHKEEQAQYRALLNTPLGQEAYRQQYNIPKDIPIEKFVGDASETAIPDSVFTSFYDSDKIFGASDDEYGEIDMGPRAVPAGEAMNNPTYRSRFNF